MKLLEGIKVVNLAINLPGPAAGRRLQKLGAQVIKVEPPGGDPMSFYKPKWYAEMAEGQEVVTLDIKGSDHREQLNKMLEETNLLITATRPAALERLGLGWHELHAQFPNLCQVAIVGYPSPCENEPGHDLTYQAKHGLLAPPQMPRTLIADMAGAEIAASEALALLLAKERGHEAGYALVALSEAAQYMSEPYRTGLTQPGTMLGGGLPEYNIYATSDGWVAVAALEPHFKAAMEKALNFESKNPDELRPIFAQKSAAEWEEWAREFDLPIVAVK
jgi:alpha-methylacyl-CoA racemase